MRLSSFFQLLVVVTWLMMAACYWLGGATTLMSAASLMYLALFSILIIVAVSQGKSSVYTLIILLCLYGYTKYLLSGFYVLFHGMSNMAESLAAFTPDHYEHYLSYALFGFSVATLGLMLGGRCWRPGTERRQPQFSDEIVALIRPGRLFLWVVVTVSIGAYLKFLYGMNPELNESSLNGLRTFLRGTIVREFFVLMMFLLWHKYSRLDRLLLLSGLLILLLANLFVESSRAGLVFILYLFLLMKVAKEGDFIIRGRSLRRVFYAIVFSFLLFPTITAIRWVSSDRNFYLAPDLELITRHENLFGSGADVVVKGLERSVELDAALRISNDMYVNDPGDMLSFASMLKRVANFILHVGHPLGILPGDVFEVMLPQYLYDHIYLNRYIGFDAQEWGLWEYFYAAYGYWGGLCVVFSYMFFIAFFWNKLIQSRSPFMPFLLIISGYFFYCFLLNYDPAYVIISFLMELGVFVVILPLVSQLSIYRRRLRI